MKILYLSHRIPYPPNKGDKIRSYNQVRYLSERHQVDLACLVDNPEDVHYDYELRKLCRRVFVKLIYPFKAKAKGIIYQLLGSSISVGYFYHKAVQDTVDKWLTDTKYDAIICFSSTMAEYIFRSCLFVQTDRPQLIMDFCDVDSDKWSQYAHKAGFPFSLIYYLESLRVRSYEHRIQRTFDHTLLISQQEAELFARNNESLERLSIVKNGIDSKFFDPKANFSPIQIDDRIKAPTLVFTGAMDYQANVDAAKWFCYEILPVIRRDFPLVQFKIVGSKPTPTVKRLSEIEGVEVTGFVTDIRPYYAMADVCVVPLRVARGIQNKLLEAMAMEKAVVTTSAANKGVQGQNLEHLLVKDSADDFAKAVMQCLSSAELRAKLGQSARSYVIKQFDWETNLAYFNRILAPQNTSDCSDPEDTPSGGKYFTCRSGVTLSDSPRGKKHDSIEVV